MAFDRKIIVVIIVFLLESLMIHQHMLGYSIMYMQGPYEKIDILVMRDVKNLKTILWHAKNYFGLQEDVHIAKKILPVGGAVVGAGVSAAITYKEIQKDYKNALDQLVREHVEEGFLYDTNRIVSRDDLSSNLSLNMSEVAKVTLPQASVGTAVGGAIGAGIGSLISPTSKGVFGLIEKWYGAHYMADISVAQKIEKTKDEMISKALLKKDDPDDRKLFFVIIIRNKKRLTIIGDGTIYPCGTYELSIQKSAENEHIVDNKETSSDGDVSCDPLRQFLKK